MIELRTPQDRKVFIKASSVVRIHEAGPSSSRTRSYVTTSDGETIESDEHASTLASMVETELAKERAA